MFKNYLKTAVRSLRSNPAFTSTNVAGLAVGMTCFLLILLYVQDELAFDRTNQNIDRIARVVSDYSDEAGTRSFARTNPGVAPAMREEMADVEAAVRFQHYTGPLRAGDVLFNEDAMFYAEVSIFHVFTFPLVSGDPETALEAPFTAVLSETAARKYFGDTDPMGRTVVLSDTLSFTVTGIARDVPAQSHLQFDVLLSFSTYQAIRAARGTDLDALWTQGTYYTYVLLSGSGGFESVEKDLPALVERHVGNQAVTGTHYELRLQPLADIHLKSNLRQELGPNGSIRSVYVFSGIAILILIISCINFMNLATARSSQRAREVGVRKALGAERQQLVRQFLGEAILLSTLALALAVVLVVALLPWFNQFAGKSISLGWRSHWPYVPAMIVFAGIVGAFAGSYPALFLSSFRPVRVLKGSVSGGRLRLAGVLRRGLVVVQFTISIGIIAGTVIALQQVRYMEGQELGFDKEQIAVIPFYWEGAVLDRYETFKQKLLQQASVRGVTASGDVPGRMFTSMSYWIEGMSEGERAGTNALIVDPDFAETYGLEIVAGRDFSHEMTADLGSSFVLNETAVRETGMTPDEIIGKRYHMNTDGPVIGVVKDFHFEGLQKEVEPLAMTVWPSWFGYVSVRLGTENMAASIAEIEETWKSVIPDRPFESFFLDQDFDRLYQSEQRFGQLFSVFGGLAIFISCLGLFGLAVFMAEQRRKEIGIRKALGASVPNIVLLLNRDATVLVVISTFIAAPIAYLAMNAWLNSFAYRIDISWAVFALVGLFALGAMWLTVAYQSIRAALTDPVNVLKYE